MLMPLGAHSKDNTGKVHNNKEKGVGLVEILIAVILLSFGFLAAAQMQVQGMRFSQGAYLESQAYFMISDMMDRMRANKAGTDDGGYSNVATQDGLINPGCDNNFCSAADQATQDIYDWSANLYNLRGVGNFVPLLPSTVTDPAIGEIIQREDGVYTLEVRWNEKIGGANETQVLSVDFAP